MRYDIVLKVRSHQWNIYEDFLGNFVEHGELQEVGHILSFLQFIIFVYLSPSPIVLLQISKNTLLKTVVFIESSII